MKDLNQKEQHFLKKWKERRKNKWLFVFVHGSIYWGLPVAIVTYGSLNNFDMENINWTKLLISVILFGIGGLGVGLFQFKQIEKNYLELSDEIEE